MKRKFRTSAYILAALLLAAGLSCVTTEVARQASTIPIAPSMEVRDLGPTRGSSTAWSFLGLWMWGRPETGAAMDEAVREKGGDALVDVRCYQTWRWFVLFTTTTVYVEGKAVKLSEGRKK